ncbi:unnamed protein product [Acanthoscelides obtectus]|uniref:Uncharacterized protein n=1 Tax=Acanthoscelides obtectus TaxID=200917 RepID=A0A9P0LNJ4_ACAOB|nr:unnamed protein product [Acanthoscelides obtectus]CAK1668526.1 hypothetical protein AOBTE_LOCUS26461 [Acanthoscelides obtectus]
MCQIETTAIPSFSGFPLGVNSPVIRAQRVGLDYLVRAVGACMSPSLVLGVLRLKPHPFIKSLAHIQETYPTLRFWIRFVVFLASLKGLGKWINVRLTDDLEPDRLEPFEFILIVRLVWCPVLKQVIIGRKAEGIASGNAAGTNFCRLSSRRTGRLEDYPWSSLFQGTGGDTKFFCFKYNG